MKWDKQVFLKDMRSHSTREVVKVGEILCDFTENNADEVAWGRGKEVGTVTFKSKSDFGLVTLFQMTSRGAIKFNINTLREKGIPKPVIRDFLLKLESNFLKDYDPDNNPIDRYQDMSELFNTSSQVDKFTQCIEGIAYRLRQ